MIHVSHSSIRTFKECRKKYYFAYDQGLIPVETQEPLLLGSSFHQKIADITKKGKFEPTNDKTDAMAEAWGKKILPILKMKPNTEMKFDYVLKDKEFPNEVHVTGFIDGECEDGLFVEHKTAGAPIDELYINKLAWDEQVPTYLLLRNDLEMWYTVCQKPTIRQKQNETLEDYIQRCVLWFEDGTENKIAMFKVRRAKEELAEHKRDIVAIAHEMKNCTNFYRNPYACSLFKCSYSSICLNYDPQFITGFKRKSEVEADD